MKIFKISQYNYTFGTDEDIEHVSDYIANKVVKFVEYEKQRTGKKPEIKHFERGFKKYLNGYKNGPLRERHPYSINHNKKNIPKEIRKEITKWTKDQYPIIDSMIDKIKSKTFEKLKHSEIYKEQEKWQNIYAELNYSETYPYSKAGYLETKRGYFPAEEIAKMFNVSKEDVLSSLSNTNIKHHYGNELVPFFNLDEAKSVFQ
jgi:hypothetical protein